MFDGVLMGLGPPPPHPPPPPPPPACPTPHGVYLNLMTWCVKVVDNPFAPTLNPHHAEYTKAQQ